MLVTNKKIGDSIRIITDSGTATILIRDLLAGGVSIGIDAPKFIRIEFDDMRHAPTLDTDTPVDERDISRKIKEKSSHPCRKCAQPSYDIGGLCFKCDQAEQGD